MRLLLATVVALSSCAIGRPAPTEDQMPEGRIMCLQVCEAKGRAYFDYMANGDCFCKPKTAVYH